MSPSLALLLGLWIGAAVGFFAAALCRASADADRRAGVEPTEPWPRGESQSRPAQGSAKDIANARSGLCTIQSITLAICLIGLVAAVALAYANGTSIFKITAAIAAPKTSAATPASFPCVLPAVEGGRAVAVVELRGGVLNLTCSGTVPLIKPVTPKGAQ
jgi:hypothetical protein